MPGHRSRGAREQESRSRLLDLYKRAALVAASKRDAKLCYSAGTSPGSLPWLRKIWGTPEKLNTFKKLDSMVKKIQMSGMKHWQVVLNKNQVKNIVNYLLRRKNTLTNSRVQNIWKKTVLEKSPAST